MHRIARFTDPIARLLMATIFVLSALSKLGAPEATQGYMSAMGVPGVLLFPTIAFELVAGGFLIAGLFTRPVALVLGVFSLLTAAIFHSHFADQTQMIMFLKNLAMSGGFLLLAKDGAPGLSIDAMRSRRKLASA